MNRREFFGLSLVPLATPALAQSSSRAAAPISRQASAGMLPNVPLYTHNNKPVKFYDDLVRGKTVLIHFFLIQCADGRCPVAMANLKKAQELLGERMGKDVFFISITLQPLFDTPQNLKNYAEIFDPKPGWDLVTGSPADIELLRKTLGFVDSDPEVDKDLTNHTGMARYGSDKFERWGMVSLRSSPNNIVSSFKSLTS